MKRSLVVHTTQGDDTYPPGSGWEYERLDAVLKVTTGDGAVRTYAPGFWMSYTISPSLDEETE